MGKGDDLDVEKEMNLDESSKGNVYNDASEKRSASTATSESTYKEKVLLNFEVFVESVTMQQLDKKEPMNLEWSIKDHKFPAINSKNINLIGKKIYFVDNIAIQAKLNVE